MRKNYTNQRAPENAALAIDREVKARGAASFLRGKKSMELIEAVLTARKARSPDMHLIGSERMIFGRDGPLHLRLGSLVVAVRMTQHTCGKIRPEYRWCASGLWHTVLSGAARQYEAASIVERVRTPSRPQAAETGDPGRAGYSGTRRDDTRLVIGSIAKQSTVCPEFWIVSSPCSSQ
jgi:hypothetical protein